MEGGEEKEDEEEGGKGWEQKEVERTEMWLQALVGNCTWSFPTAWAGAERQGQQLQGSKGQPETPALSHHKMSRLVLATHFGSTTQRHVPESGTAEQP